MFLIVFRAFCRMLLSFLRVIFRTWWVCVKHPIAAPRYLWNAVQIYREMKDDHSLNQIKAAVQCRLDDDGRLREEFKTMYDIELRIFNVDEPETPIDSVNISGFKTPQDARRAYAEACAILEARAEQSLQGLK